LDFLTLLEFYREH